MDLVLQLSQYFGHRFVHFHRFIQSILILAHCVGEGDKMLTLLGMEGGGICENSYVGAGRGVGAWSQIKAWGSY